MNASHGVDSGRFCRLERELVAEDAEDERKFVLEDEEPEEGADKATLLR
jgi:hypothetical protein